MSSLEDPLGKALTYGPAPIRAAAGVGHWFCHLPGVADAPPAGLALRAKLAPGHDGLASPLTGSNASSSPSAASIGRFFRIGPYGCSQYSGSRQVIAAV